MTANLPLIGGDVSSALASAISDALTYDAPSSGLQDSQGITVESVISAEDLFAGAGNRDLLTLNYSKAFTAPTAPISASGELAFGHVKIHHLTGDLHVDQGNAVQLTSVVDLTATLTVSNPAAKIPVLGKLLPRALPGMRWWITI